MLNVSRGLKTIKSEFATLQNLNWLEQHTRALIIEFSLYNPNINLFSYGSLLFEYLPSGTIMKTHRFSAFKLYDLQNEGFFLFCDIVFLFIIIGFMVKEIVIICKNKREYFKQVRNYVKWLLVITTWVSFVMYLYKLYARLTLVSKIFSSSGSYISFQSIDLWNSALIRSLGFCAFISSMLFIKILEFSRSVSFMISIMKKSLSELAGFMLILSLTLLAFVSLLYVTFNDRNPQYSTFERAIMECLNIVTQRFSNTANIKFNNILELIFVIFYVLVVPFLLINLLVTIVTVNFSKGRREFKENMAKENSILSVYIKKRILGFFGNQSSSNINEVEYLDIMDAFEMRCKALVQHISNSY